MQANQAQTGIILFGHGARDPRWAEPLERLRERVSLRHPSWQVKLAFLELMAPTLEQCVAELAAQGVSELTIVPAFIARGAHLRRDLPLLVEAVALQYPAMKIQISDALGEADAVQDAMADWIAGLAMAATNSPPKE